MAGLQPEAGPRQSAFDRQLGQEGRLDHAGMAGDHHQLARMAPARRSRALGHPPHESGPALAAGGDGLVGILVPVDQVEPFGELGPVQPVGLPGVELAQPAVGDQRWRAGPGPGPGRPEGRRHQLGRLDRPGQHAGVEGIGAPELPGGAAAGPAGPRPAGARGR